MARDLTQNAQPLPVMTEPNPMEWRAAMGRFPSGVTVVSTWDGETPMGATVSAFCSVSLEPPLLLVCLAHASPVLAPIQQSGVFGVNILPEGGRDLALWFATTPERERFVGHDHRAENGGAPQLGVAPLFIDCVLEQAHLAGDHMILVGRGVRIDHASATLPLVYHKGGFFKLPTEG